MKLILTILLFTFFIFHFTFLFSDTIIDSVYSVPELDGTILFNPEGEPELLNNFTYQMQAGDTGVPLVPGPPPNSCNRSFVSFELPQIPENYDLDSVYIRLYQHRAFCNGSELGGFGFPEWNITGGDTIKCIMSHIDYGFQLDFEDWEKGDIGNPDTFTHNIGTITESGIEGYRYLNVTEYALQDYDMGRILTQYRIAFEVNTDGDSLKDGITIKTFEANNESKRPKLFFYLSDGTGVEDEVSKENGVTIIPNPINNSTNIYFNLLTQKPIYIELYNIKGQKVKNIVSSPGKQGKNKVFVNMASLSSGIYFLKLNYDGETQVMKKIAIIH
jgi:hypothetical protein